MKIKSYSLGLIILVVLLGGVFGAQLMDLWNTKGQPRISSGSGRGSSSIVSKPEDIRGSFQLHQICNQFDIPVETFLRAFGLENIPQSEYLTSGSLEDLYEELMGIEVEIGNGSVKLFVALYNGFPYTVYEPTFLPERAVNMLLERGIDDKWQKYITEHSVALAPLSQDDILSLADKLNNIDTMDSIFEIKGVTTFKDVIAQGISQDEIESVLGTSMPDSFREIRSYCEEQGLNFGHVKSRLDDMLQTAHNL